MGGASTLRLSIPSKAFLAGEYLALSGGPALVVAVEPRFSLWVKSADGMGKNPFHDKSPAGILWHQHQAELKNYWLQFEDPHEQRGGWGGSTAEFALLQGLLQYLGARLGSTRTSFDVLTMLNEYRDLLSPIGLHPSGADLVGQVRGHLTWFDRNAKQMEKFKWPFDGLGLLLFRTPYKLPTHEHLRTLPEFSTVSLQAAMSDVQRGLLQADCQIFAQGMKAYAEELDHLGFVAETTRTLLSRLHHSTILAKKGCGAMGADVICVVYTKAASEEIAKSEVAKAEIMDEAMALGLHLVADENSIGEGLQLENLNPRTAEVST